MKTQYLFMLLVVFMLSCDKNIAEEETSCSSVFILKEDYRSAKIKNPGLNSVLDTIATKVVIFEDGKGKNSFLYDVNNDSIWSESFKKMVRDIKSSNDTTIRISNSRIDTIIEHGMYRAIPKYVDSFRIELLSGFNDSNIKIYSNEQVVYDSKKLDIFKISKSEIDSLGIALDGSKVCYVPVDKGYNVIGIFKYENQIKLRFAYVF